MTIAIKATFNNKNLPEDVDNNELVVMTLKGITIESLSNHDDDAKDNVD